MNNPTTEKSSKRFPDAIDGILNRNRSGYVMSKFLSTDDMYRMMREDINTLCIYIETKETR